MVAVGNGLEGEVFPAVLGGHVLEGASRRGEQGRRSNLLHLPMDFVDVDDNTVNYVYSADGEKLYVEENPSGGTLC